MLSLISLPVNSCSATMASRRSKDKHSTTNSPKPLAKQEPASLVDIANRFTALGTIPKQNYSTVLASSYDPYVIVPVKTTFSRNPNASQYVSKQYRQKMFSIEPNRALTKDPLKLATSYFPWNFHWIPEHIGKDLRYHSAILFHEKSIFIKPISDKVDTSKIIYHSVILLDIVTEEKWGLNPASTKPLPGWTTPYSYHDYIHAWFKFMLHQDENMTHSWFVNFDKSFNSHLPLWITRWWTQFGPIIDIFPKPLTSSFKYFTSVYKIDSHGTNFPATFHFVKKYKVPWILKWMYVKEGDVLTRQWFVK